MYVCANKQIRMFLPRIILNRPKKRREGSYAHWGPWYFHPSLFDTPLRRNLGSCVCKYNISLSFIHFCTAVQLAKLWLVGHLCSASSRCPPLVLRSSMAFFPPRLWGLDPLFTTRFKLRIKEVENLQDYPGYQGSPAEQYMAYVFAILPKITSYIHTSPPFHSAMRTNDCSIERSVSYSMFQRSIDYSQKVLKEDVGS